MALRGVHLVDWRTAQAAAERALEIQPTAESNLEIVRLAKMKLSGE